MTTLATIPPDDLHEFVRLPEKIRTEIRRWVAALTPLLDLERGIQKQLESVARQFDVSPKTARYKYDRYRKSCDWRVLKNKSIVRDDNDDLPEAFVQFWRKLGEKHQRAWRSAYKELLERWGLGETFPGYPRDEKCVDRCWPKADPYTKIPASWTYRNLMRYKSTPLEETAMRVGLGRAVTLHGPKALSTRVGLWHFSHLFFDDMDQDDFVHLLTKANAPQICRAVELGAQDFLSGSRFEWGARPQFKRKDGTTDTVKEANMRFLVAKILWSHGYSPYGTELVVEHGTATLRPGVIDLLEKGTGGKLTVRKGGFLGKEQAIAGMYYGGGGGNPRHKAPLESLHNLIHNMSDALPAQTGKDIEHRPEWLGGGFDEKKCRMGLLYQTNLLLKAYQQLPEFRAKLLRLPTMEFYAEMLPTVSALYEKIDCRTDHDLQGWNECGFVTTDFRLTAASEQWLSRDEFLALPAPAQALLTEMVKGNGQLMRPRNLSPREVFQMKRLEQPLIRPPVSLIAELLYADLYRERQTVDGSYFEFEDRELSPEPLIYESRLLTFDGHEQELRDGDKFNVVANPFDLGTLWIYDARGGFLGTAPRAIRTNRADRDGAKRQWGHNKKRLADQLVEARERHSDITRKANADAKHNADVIAGLPVTSEEKARAKDDAQRARTIGAETLQTLLEHEAPVAATTEASPNTNTEDGETILDELFEQ